MYIVHTAFLTFLHGDDDELLFKLYDTNQYCNQDQSHPRRCRHHHRHRRRHRHGDAAVLELPVSAHSVILIPI